MRLRAGQLIDVLLDTVAPSCCPGCDCPPQARSIWCRACREELRRETSRTIGQFSIWTPWVYSGSVVQAVKRLKFQNRPELAGALATAMLASPGAPTLASQTLLVPVPLHPRRLAERGYNQAALLARALARRCGLGCAPRALARIRFERTQVGCDADQRRKNVILAYHAGGKVAGRSVVLVDDVVTTGATVQACALALQSAGARIQTILALARAGCGSHIDG